MNEDRPPPAPLPLPLQLSLPGVQLTATGAQGLDNLTAQGAGRLVASLDRFSGAVNWLIGDVTIEAMVRARDGDRSLAAVPLPADQPHVARCVRVSVAFAHNRRRPSLSWSHHREVAHLDVVNADRLLALCEAEDLTVDQLRSIARQEAQDRAPRLDPDLAPTKPPRIPQRAIQDAFAAEPDGGFLASFTEPGQVVAVSAEVMERVRTILEADGPGGRGLRSVGGGL